MIKCSLCGKREEEEEQMVFNNLRRAENKKYLDAALSFFNSNVSTEHLINSCDNCIALLDTHIEFKHKINLHAYRTELENKARRELELYLETVYPQKLETRIVEGILLVIPESRKNYAIKVTAPEQTRKMSFSSRIPSLFNNNNQNQPNISFASTLRRRVASTSLPSTDETHFRTQSISEKPRPDQLTACLLEPEIEIIFNEPVRTSLKREIQHEQEDDNDDDEPMVIVSPPKRGRRAIVDLDDLGITEKRTTFGMRYTCSRCPKTIQKPYKSKTGVIYHAKRCIRAEEAKNDNKSHGFKN